MELFSTSRAFIFSRNNWSDVSCPLVAVTVVAVSATDVAAAALRDNILITASIKMQKVFFIRL
jgi:hypothetical protein